MDFFEKVLIAFLSMAFLILGGIAVMGTTAFIGCGLVGADWPLCR